MRTKLLWIVVMFGVLIGWNCGGGSGPGRQLLSITVQPASADAAEPGGTFLFNVVGTFDQAPTNDAVTAQWSTADPTIATIDATGLATCVAAGSVVLTASATGKTGTVQSSATLNCTASGGGGGGGGGGGLSGVCLVTSLGVNARLTGSCIGNVNGLCRASTDLVNCRKGARAKSPTLILPCGFPPLTAVDKGTRCNP